MENQNEILTAAITTIIGIIIRAIERRRMIKKFNNGGNQETL